jgi:nitrogen regulatory protein P-II 1
MKEIKAYIRDSKIEEVVEALESSGVSGMTITPVHAILKWASSDISKYSLSFNYRLDAISDYTQVIKIELVCKDSDVPRLLKVIKMHAHTGQSGDGMIFVTEVQEAVKIKTGTTGEKALE